MFSTCEVIPPDAGEPVTNDNIGPLLAAVIAAVRERRDDNGAAALDSISGNREESNLDVPDDVVPAGGSQDGGGPGSGQPPEEEDENVPEINPTSKAKPKPKPKGLPRHQRVPEDEEVADRGPISTAGLKNKPHSIVTVTDRGEPPFTRRRLKVIINVSFSLQPERKQNTKAKPKPRLDRHQSGQLPFLDELWVDYHVWCLYTMTCGSSAA